MNSATRRAWSSLLLLATGVTSLATCRDFAETGVQVPMGGRASEAGASSSGAGALPIGGVPEGSSGFSGAAGAESGASGGAGDSGDTQAGGAAGAGGAEGQQEQAPAPLCRYLDPWRPGVVRAVGISMVATNPAPQVYSSDVDTETMTVRWRAQASADSWVSWLCFDLLPRAARVAAMNLPNGHPEIFATSTDGYLFVRRSSLLGWTSWLLFPAPTREAFVTDVATLGGAFPAVYIIADGQVYARGKVGPDGYSNYGPWLDLPMNQARFIGASISLGGARQVFAVTAAGELQVASQVSDDAQSAFGAWSHLETLSAEVADLDVIPEADETLLYVLDASGSVRLGTYSNGGLTWQQIRSESDMPKFVAVAALARPSLSRVVVAVSASGQLYQLEDNLSWTTGDTR